MNSFIENVRRKIKTPTSKNQANREKKLKKKKSKAVKEVDTGPGTVYIGHIPHGFYEKEMLKYFSQFGKVTNIRLARSRKTLRSKGYAFVQFKSAEVAKIVAESMNNYLFFEKLLKCEFVPEEKVHKDTFNGWKSKFTSSDKNRNRQNRKKAEESIAKSKSRRLSRFKKLKNYLKGNSIEYKTTVFSSNSKKE